MDNLFTKLNKVIKPQNMEKWKQLQEECGGAVGGGAIGGAVGSGAAGMTGGSISTGSSALGMPPCPALGQAQSKTGTRVNGVPVEGKSAKKKKKKRSQNEDFDKDNLFNNAEDALAITIVVFKDDNDSYNAQQNYLQQLREINKLELLDDFIQFITQKGYSKEDLLLQYIDPVKIFKEKYEEITDLIAKQLDRLNFEYANTKDIIYKKENDTKYLIKFDSDSGKIKFKAIKDDEILVEKEWQIENEKDVAKIFLEIEKILN